MAIGEPRWPDVRFRVIGEAWELYKRYWPLWSLTTLVAIVGYSLVARLSFALFDLGHARGHGGFRLFLPTAHGAVGWVLSTVISGVFVGGMIRMASSQVRGRTPRFEDALSVKDVWLDLILVSLLYGAAVAVGIAVFVIPGLIIFGVGMLAIPLVVEGRQPATAALIQSWHALKSQWLTVTVFHLFLALVSVSGAICCVTILCTGPLYSLSVAILYRDFFPIPPSMTAKPAAEAFPEI